ncbi:hypothetical protein [Grimontia sp. NTOU-MAR1]|uniref:hypothetical protein n=1 Tax=Grimontia sp. NTOU-MAR1 TaxID=3111011 RepID=UPI002DBC55C5|nr:hypothetical protein [Grimontia sp. NTOU-MAR1]WRV96369.1 hypothetical protein VP504_09510 [Grimontia sp. NTOU-MAR1]
MLKRQKAHENNGPLKEKSGANAPQKLSPQAAPGGLTAFGQADIEQTDLDKARVTAIGFHLCRNTPSDLLRRNPMG